MSLHTRIVLFILSTKVVWLFTNNQPKDFNDNNIVETNRFKTTRNIALQEDNMHVTEEFTESLINRKPSCELRYAGYFIASKDYACESTYTNKTCLYLINIYPDKWTSTETRNGYGCVNHVSLQFLHSIAIRNSIIKYCKLADCVLQFRYEHEKCRKHFEGQCCLDEVNYCHSRSCRHRATCLPAYGGFLCNCRRHHIGIYCETIKDKFIRSMRHPDFTYDYQQYAEHESKFIFHAESFGTRPSIEVDFGDGNVTLVKEFFDSRVNLSSLTKKFTTKKQVFKHFYEKDGIYNVKVRAWNMFYIVFNRTYEIQVFNVNFCKWNVSIVNAATNRENASDLYRMDLITIVSQTVTNCTGIIFNYFWQVFRIDSFDNNLKNANAVNLTKIEFFNPVLIIPPYSLNFGKYVVILITRLHQVSESVRNSKAYFIINRLPTVAHIDGGNDLWINHDSAFQLDGTMSFDPNYPRSAQPELFYKWECLIKNSPQFTCDFKIKPILVFPPKALPVGKHVVKLTVSLPLKDKLRYTGNASVIITVHGRKVFRHSIRCIRNCFGGKANPNQLVEYSGICVLCSQRNVEGIWMVISNPERQLVNRRNLRNDTRIIQHGTKLVLEAGQLESGSYFRVIYGNSNNHTLNFVEGFAQVDLETYSEPYAGECSVYPPVGIGMFSDFTVTCYSFRMQNDTSESSHSLQYEFVQYFDLIDRQRNQLFLGSNSVGVLKGIILAPGHAYANYTTAISVTARNYEGLTADYAVNVTVLSPLLTLKDPILFTKIFYSIANITSRSPLEDLFSRSSFDRPLEQVAVYANIFGEMLNNSVTKLLRTKENQKVQFALLLYVSGSSIYDFNSLMLSASALNCIIGLPTGTYHGNTVPTATGILKGMMDFLVMILNNDVRNYQGQVYNFGIYLTSIIGRLLLIIQQQDDDHKDVTGELTEILLEFVDLYNRNFETQHGKISYTTRSADLIMMLAEPTLSALQPTVLPGKALIRFTSNESVPNFIERLNLKFIVFNDVFEKNLEAPSYPLIKVDIRSNINNNSINIPHQIALHVQPQRYTTNSLKWFHGGIPVKLFWKVEESDVQMHSVTLYKGEKLLLKFQPIFGGHKLKIVVLKGRRPRLNDFWIDGLVVPRRGASGIEDNGLTVFVDDDVVEDTAVFYVGILADTDTLRILMRHVEEPLFPGAFQYEDDENASDESDYTYIEDHVKTKCHMQESLENEQVQVNEEILNSTSNISVLPYKFVAYAVKCMKWNESIRSWEQQCQVTSKTTLHRVYCKCSNPGLLRVSHRVVAITFQKYFDYHFRISYTTSTLLLSLFIFAVVMFSGLFVWAVHKDRKDHLKHDLCFLVDNDPTARYTYLVIVYTGRKLKSGTTSNVGIQLEGVKGTSLPHILRDKKRPVLKRSYQDWFVLQTMKSLGELYCIHLWTDFSGAQPSWYCDRIAVHDVQTESVWIFIVDSWFDPLNGNGSMAYTIYHTSNFSPMYRYKLSLYREFDFGMHGWFSMLSGHLNSPYTRTQRVAVAFLHLTLIMVTLILLQKIPEKGNPASQIVLEGSFRWEIYDVLKGALAALIVFPIHIAFVMIFRITRPTPEWLRVQGQELPSGYNINLSMAGSSASCVFDTSYSTTVVEREQKSGRKRVGFITDSFATESRGPLKPLKFVENLQKAAGESKVVPKRAPISKVELQISKKLSLVEYSDSYNNESFSEYYCLPSYVVFILWVVMFMAAIPALYVILVYGTAYVWITSLHYAVSLFIAIATSVLILEPMKLMFMAWYTHSQMKKRYYIENRSNQMHKLLEQYDIPLGSANRLEEILESLRQQSIYKPIGPSRLKKLISNRRRQYSIKVFWINGLVIIFLIILFRGILTILREGEPHKHYKHIDEVITGKKDYLLTEIEDHEDLILYINNTLIPHLYFYESADNLEPIVDDNNYLVGVVRLRQVRLSKRSCKTKGVKLWSARCQQIYDTHNYLPGWKRLPLDEEVKENSPWIHTKEVEINNLFVDHYIGNASYFPREAYVAYLNRTRSASLKALKELVDNNWFDIYTAVVFIDIQLYNPYLNFLSLITIMAVKHDHGVMNAYPTIRSIKILTTDLYPEILVAIMFAMVLGLAIFDLLNSYDTATRTAKGESRLSMLDAIFCCATVVTVSFYIKRIFTMEGYSNLLSDINTEKYIHFRNIVVWDGTLTVFINILIILVLWKLVCFLRMFSNINLAQFALGKIMTSVPHYLVLFVGILWGFTFIGYILFGQVNYQFSTPCYVFISLLSFVRRIFACNQFYGPLSLELAIYVFLLFVTVYFVLRWILTTMIIRKYMEIKKSLHARNKLLSSNYQYETEIATENQKFIKDKRFRRAFLEQKLKLKNMSMGYLTAFLFKTHVQDTSDFGAAKENANFAMSLIALDILNKRYKTSLRDDKTASKERQVLQEEQAKAVARSVIVIHEIRCKLQYLSYKVDSYIRWARYENFSPF